MAKPKSKRKSQKFVHTDECLQEAYFEGRSRGYDQGSRDTTNLVIGFIASDSDREDVLSYLFDLRANS